MRLLAPTVALLLLSLPLAVAEDGSLQALGGQGGPRAGVLGFQWDDDSAVGARYWFNATEGDEAALILTTCMVLDSGGGIYCERHRVVA